MNFCSTCGQHVFIGDLEPRHECPPQWRCRCQSRHQVTDDGYRIYATNAQQAAEKAAARYFLDRRKFYLLTERHGEYAGILVEVTSVADDSVALFRTFIADNPTFIAEQTPFIGEAASAEFAKTWPKVRS